MAFVSLENVTVEFPIYDSRSRSLRAQLMRFGDQQRVGYADIGCVTVRALIDVTLSFQDGDRVGLIGRNGSGKSTLLKLVGGIYEPQQGVMRTSGTRCTLLDLVLGMDMDASGYENMTLRGLALGIPRREVAKRMDDIAEFTELGDHLALPVRTYSSGMLLRLAFGISTCWPRDIVLIDEAIGAGDQAFMKKARDRLEAMLANSRILLLASHSEDVVRRMCDKGLVMHEGRVAFYGPIDEALGHYAKAMAA
jgi:ABC-type polysaccharide/polyol phosphate transport system ATPase subunit